VHAPAPSFVLCVRCTLAAPVNCGLNAVKAADGSCACNVNNVPTGDGVNCCRPNAVVTNGACQCKAGYTWVDPACGERLRVSSRSRFCRDLLCYWVGIGLACPWRRTRYLAISGHIALLFRSVLPSSHACHPSTPSHPSIAVLSDGGGGGNDGSGQIFGGANSYPLHTYVDADRLEILDAMQAAGFKAIRIFILALAASDKGGNSRAVRDVEGPVGVFNDDQLNMVDQLMLEASQRKMKLIITLHDRYSLGCWCAAPRGAGLGGQGARDAGPWVARGTARAARLPACSKAGGRCCAAGLSSVQSPPASRRRSDAYQSKYGLPTSPGCATPHDVSSFYTSAAAAADIDRRITYIVNHRNGAMGNRAWKDIPEAILAFDIQNEGQSYLNSAKTAANPSWVCNRATALRPQMSGNGILIGTGGGADIDDSIIDQHFACGAIDVVGVHSYDAGAWAARLGGIVSKAKAAGKRIIVEEFGQQGGDRASSLSRQITDIRNAGVPWMVWQVTKPNKPDDLEVWKDDGAAWPVLSNNGQQSLSAGGAFAWPEIFSSSGPACTAANCAACAAGSTTICGACKSGFTLSNGQCSQGECRALNAMPLVCNPHPWICMGSPAARLCPPFRSAKRRLRPERRQGRRWLVRVQRRQRAHGRRRQLLPPQLGGDKRRLPVQGRLHLGGPRLR
jgi:hypothetical protein